MKKVVVHSRRVIHWWRIIAVIVAVFVAALLWPSADDQTQQRPQSTAPSSTSQMAAIGTSSPCAKPEKVIARPGSRTKVPLKSGCAWRTVNDPISLKHEQACLSFRANRNSNLTQKEGVCPGGSFKAHFPSDMELTSMEVTSLERFEVPLIIEYFYARSQK